MRSPRDFLLMRKSPRRVSSQMSTKPRNLKVSGFDRPRFSQFCAAKRPNSIRRVLSGCSDSANSCNLSRIASQNRRASSGRWKPTMSSAYRTMIMSPVDEPEDALVADPVFEEADDPLLGNFREERPDIGVEYEIHLLAADDDDQRVQR